MTMPSLRNKRIWVAGHRGMVGQAVLRQLKTLDCTLLTADRAVLDLRDQGAVNHWMASHQPEVVILAAATVGGIEANRTRPADFLYDNLMIGANIIHAAAQARVEKLVYLGSSCIYPRAAAQPIREDALLTGALELTNEAYALAKIACLKLCQAYRRQHGLDFVSAMPCNLYGPGDTYDARRSHVIPALILKLTAAVRDGAESVTLWGSGTPLREFLHVDDLGRALVMMAEAYQGDDAVNVGSGAEISIRDLAQTIAGIVGFTGDIRFDPSMPDGTPRKVLDSGVMRGMGWAPEISLEDGLREVIAQLGIDIGGRAHAA